MTVKTLLRPTIDTDIVQHPARYSFLVIGYGNELRGDDAVGVQVAKTIANWHLPEVKAIVTHQLLPELAVEIAKADYVIFVDACGEESCARNVQLTPISVQKESSPTVALTHTHSAQGLLALTQKVYDSVPQAWLLQVPTESFDFGEQLSSMAHRGIDKAVQTIERFHINYQVPYPVTLNPCMKLA
ncbi:MAG: hydrogenase maturation protease [Cyanobacteria bacterium J06621_11]